MTTDNSVLSALSSDSAAYRAAIGGSPPLRSLLESPAFTTADSPLTLALGEDCAGQAHVADLKRLPHLLIGGSSGSGKSTFLRAVVTTLIIRCEPAEVRLFLYSSSGQTFRACTRIPHLMVSPEADPEAAVAFLDWARHEMNRRYGVLATAGVRNLDGYHSIQTAPREGAVPGPIAGGTAQIPYIVAVFDDLAPLVTCAKMEVLESMAELCQMSRAVGIHLLVATRDVSSAALPALITVNFTARLSFRQPSRMASAILGFRGADDLSDPGEAMFLPPTATAPASLRTPFVSEEELRRVVACWRNQ